MELHLDGLKSKSMLENIIRRRLEDLLERSPSDADALSTFKKVKRGYEGVIHIVSSQGRFVAEAVHSSLSGLVKALAGEIDHQIKRWHVHRTVESA